MTLYCTEEVEGVIRRVFDYAFTTDPVKLAANYLPSLIFRRITAEPFTMLGQRITPIPLVHSFFSVFGFRIGDVAYCTDVSSIPEDSWPLLAGLRAGPRRPALQVASGASECQRGAGGD